MFASHNYEVIVDIDVGVKSDMYDYFTSKHAENLEKPNQFYVYLCDCYGDLRKYNN